LQSTERVSAGEERERLLEGKASLLEIVSEGHVFYNAA
jgi:hypothetical protein